MHIVELELFPELAIKQPGSVYYAAGSDGSIKIGYTTRPVTTRMRELDSSLIYACPGGPLDEKRHLRKWKTCRVGTSEWHRPTDELLMWLITKVINQGQTTGAQILKRLIEDRQSARDVA